jgi:hypothetical protein
MSISFAGLDQMVVTFSGEDVTPGYPVVLESNGTVKNADAEEVPVGIAVSHREGCTGVLLRGYVEMSYSGNAPGLGWTELQANGIGGLRTAGSGGDGRLCLVVNVNSEEKTVGLFL